MLVRLLPLVLLLCSFVSNAETENCELLKERVQEIDELKNNSDFEQVISLSKKVESNYVHCQKGNPVEFHRLLYSTLSSARKLKLDEQAYNQILAKIKANLKYIEGDSSLRSFEVHLQEVDFLLLKNKLDLALTKTLNTLINYENNSLVVPHLFKAHAQKTRIYLYKNELDKAIESSLIAIGSIKKHAPEKYAHLGWYYSNLGVANYLSGDFQSAYKHFLATEKEWLKIRKSEHADFASLYTNLGSVVNMLPGDNAEESIKFHKKALAIYQKHYSKSHHRVLTALANIAGTYQQIGDEDSAGQYFEQYALSYDFKKSKFTDLGRHGLYIAYLTKESRIEDAISWYRKVEKVIEKEGYDYNPLFEGMDAFVGFYTEKGRLNLAFEWAKLRFQKTVEFVGTISDDKRLVRFFEEVAQREYLIVLSNLYLKVQEQGNEKLLEQSSETMLQALSVFNINKATQNQRFQLEFSQRGESKEKAQLLTHKSRLLQSASQASVTVEQRGLLAAEIAEIDNKLKLVNPSFLASANDFKPYSEHDIQKQIHENQSIVFFIKSKNRINAVTLENNAISVIQLQEMGHSLFESKVNELSESVQQANVDYTFQLKEFNVERATELYDHLIKPLVLKQHVTFIQNSFVEQLPLAALVKQGADIKGKDIVYLVQEHQISFIPSLLSLHSERSENSKLLSSLAFGSPSLNKQNSDMRIADKIILTNNQKENIAKINALPSLPYTSVEMKSFAKQLKNSKVYSQSKATESNVRQQLDQNNHILSFATHALSVEYPSGKTLSALVLTPESGTTNIDEGLLTTEDIESMGINAELVVLSACNTAFSEDGKSNDLSGLTSSFIFAGAKNVLVSTAQISDVATAKLMAEFYANVDDGYSKALMTGMNGMINSEEYSHPYYWANFRLIGNE